MLLSNTDGMGYDVPLVEWINADLMHEYNLLYML